MFGIDNIPLNARTFGLLQELVYENSGIRVGDEHIDHMQRRLEPVCREIGVHTFEELYSHAKFHVRGKSTINAMLEALTTHETYFYREHSQFELLINEILKTNELGRRNLRILSAGCSSGEELISMRILCEESKLLDEFNIEFVGVDISKEIVAKARSGLFRETAFRAAPAHWSETYFTQTDEGFQLNESIRNDLQFVPLNLIDSFRFRILGEFDIIFCRNVMIYFDQNSKKELIENLYRRTKPGGYLFLGHAENLIQIDSAYTVRHFDRDMVYHRAAQAY